MKKSLKLLNYYAEVYPEESYFVLFKNKIECWVIMVDEDGIAWTYHLGWIPYKYFKNLCNYLKR